MEQVSASPRCLYSKNLLFWHITQHTCDVLEYIIFNFQIHF